MGIVKFAQRKKWECEEFAYYRKELLKEVEELDKALQEHSRLVAEIKAENDEERLEYLYEDSDRAIESCLYRAEEVVWTFVLCEHFKDRILGSRKPS